jgi:hypothetical protein
MSDGCALEQTKIDMHDRSRPWPGRMTFSAGTILHGCLTAGTTYDETTAWAHHQQDLQAAA